MKISFCNLFLFHIFFVLLLFFSCSVTEITISSEKIPITITIQSDQNGYVCGAGTYQVSEGDSMVISVCHAAEHYNFKEWIFTSGDSNCILWNKFDDTTVIKNINGPVSLKATFAMHEYSLIINQPLEGGTITVNPSKALYQHGETVTLELINPPVGYRLGAWTGDASGNANPTTITMTGTTTVSATLQTIPGLPNVEYVRKGASGNNTGTSWANAYTNLETAFANSGENKQIWIAGGTYQPTVTNGYSPQNGSQIFGGFTGFESDTNRVWHNNFTILTGDNSSSFVIYLNQKDNVKLNGLIIQNGTQYTVFIRPKTVGSAPIIANCIFRNNNVLRGNSAASAIMCQGKETIIRNCVFYNNLAQSSDAEGQAITITPAASGTRIQNCIFFGNDGPAVSSSVSDITNPATIISSTFYGNTSQTVYPGAIRATAGAMEIRGCILYANTNTPDGSGVTYGTQIDSAQEASYNCIQNCSQNGVGIYKKTAGYSTTTNLDVDPAFDRATQPANDQYWFSNDNTLVPFFQKNTLLLNTAGFSNGHPNIDLRGVGRPITCDYGCYERPTQ